MRRKIRILDGLAVEVTNLPRVPAQGEHGTWQVFATGEENGRSRGCELVVAGPWGDEIGRAIRTQAAQRGITVTAAGILHPAPMTGAAAQGRPSRHDHRCCAQPQRIPGAGPSA